MFGGSSGDTTVIDLSTSIASTTVFGGWSTDATLVGTSAQTAIIGFLDSAGNLLWLKYVQKPSILAVKFSTGSSTVLVMAIQSNPTKFVVMTSSGSLINSLQVQQKSSLPETLLPNGLIFLSTLKFCYACRNWNGYFEVGCYQAASSSQSINGGGRDLLGYGTFQTGGVTSGVATALTTAGSYETYCFAGGRILTSSNKMYLLLTSFVIQDFSNDFQYVIDFGVSPSSYYDFVALSYYFDTDTNCDNVLTGCLQHSDPSSANTVLLLYFITGDQNGCGGTANSQISISEKADKFANNQLKPNRGQVMNKPSLSLYTQCLGIQATAYLEPYNVLLFIPSSNALNLCKVTPYLDLSPQSMACQILSSMVDSQVRFYNAFFLSSTSLTSDVYIVGSLKQLVGDTTSLTPGGSILTNNVGFIMNFNSEISCLTFSIETLSRQISDQPLLNLQFLYNTYNPTVLVPSFGSAGLYNANFVNCANGVSNILCTQKSSDETVTIIPSTQPTITYQVGNSNSLFAIPSFTLNPTGASTCTDNYALTYSAYLSPLTTLPLFITFIPASRSFSLSTIDPTKVGTYSIQVFGTSINGQYGLLTFDIIVIGSCATGVIACQTAGCSIASQSYVIQTLSTTLTVTIPTLTVSVPGCTVNYELTSNPMSSYTTTRSFSSIPTGSTQISSETWQFSSSDNGLLQGQTSFTYTVTIQAFILYSAAHYSVFPLSFSMTVSSACSSALLTPTSPSADPLSYDISTLAPATILSLSWTTSPSGCPVTYTLSPGPAIIFISGAFVKINTNSILDIGVYTVTLTGVLTDYPAVTDTLTMGVIVTNNCGSTPLTTNNVFPITRTIQVNQVLSFTFSAWSNSYSPNCSPFTYTAVTNGITLTTTTSVIQFDNSYRQFSVYTNSNSDAGTYTVTLTGTNSLYGEEGSVVFTVIVQIDCGVIPILPTDESDKIYDLRSPAQTYTITKFSIDPFCYPINYFITQSPTISGAITFDPITRVLTLSSNSYLDAGTFIVSIIGKIHPPYTSNSASISFKVQIIDRCLSTIITTELPGLEFYYYQGQGVQNYPFAEFTESEGNCGAFIDTVNYITGGVATTLNPLFTFSQGSFPLVTFNCNTQSCQGSYEIVITGSLPYPYSSSSFNFTVHSICMVTQLNQTSYIKNHTLVKVKGVPIYYNFTDYTQTPKCGFQIKYSAKQTDGTAIPLFMSFSQKSMKFGIQTNSYSDAGVYAIQVIATVQNLQGPFTSTVINKNQTFYIEVPNPPDPLFNTAPYFESDLQNYVFLADAGNNIIHLPDALDGQGDNILFTVELGTAKRFASYIDGQVIVSPTKLDIGTYTVNIKLSDDSSNPKSNSYTFIIQIVSLEVLVQNASQSNGSSFFPQKLINSVLGDKALTAKIKNINFQGEMIVQFNEKIFIPKNYSSFNNSNLSLSIIPGPLSNASDLNFTWQIKNFTESQMTIFMNFSEPIIVSSWSVLILTLFFFSYRTKLKQSLSRMTYLFVSRPICQLG